MARKSYIIETHQVGNQVKVTACDPDSGLEVSVIGPLSATRKDISQLAVNKLEYMLAKQHKPSDDELS